MLRVINIFIKTMCGAQTLLGNKSRRNLSPCICQMSCLERLRLETLDKMHVRWVSSGFLSLQASFRISPICQITMLAFHIPAFHENVEEKMCFISILHQCILEIAPILISDIGPIQI